MIFPASDRSTCHGDCDCLDRTAAGRRGSHTSRHRSVRVQGRDPTFLGAKVCWRLEARTPQAEPGGASAGLIERIALAILMECGRPVVGDHHPIKIGVGKLARCQQPAILSHLVALAGDRLAPRSDYANERPRLGPKPTFARRAHKSGSLRAHRCRTGGCACPKPRACRRRSLWPTR